MINSVPSWIVNSQADSDRGRMLALLHAFEECASEQGRQILRNSMEHLVWPTWERRWPSAVPETGVSE